METGYARYFREANLADFERICAFRETYKFCDSPEHVGGYLCLLDFSRMNSVSDMGSLSAISSLIQMCPMPSCEQQYSRPCKERNSNQLSARSIRSFVRLMTCTIKSYKKSGDRFGASSHLF